MREGEGCKLWEEDGGNARGPQAAGVGGGLDPVMDAGVVSGLPCAELSHGSLETTWRGGRGFSSRDFLFSER